MNIALSSRHTVHATRENVNGPKCHTFGAPHGTEAYRPTTREVTCKKCLKALADEVVEVVEVQDEVVVTIAPAATEVVEAAAEALPTGVTMNPAAEVAEPDWDAVDEALGVKDPAVIDRFHAEALAENDLIEALPTGVTMNPATRVLSGPIRAMKELFESGEAEMHNGDLVLRPAGARPAGGGYRGLADLLPRW